MTKPNKNVKCTVTQCKNHCSAEDFCSLNEITIGTHEYNPSEAQCTDCKSFKMKK